VTRTSVRVGFHRLGVAAAILPLFVAIILFILASYKWLTPLINPPVWEIEDTVTQKKIEIAYGAAPFEIGRKLKAFFAPRPVPDDVIVTLEDNTKSVDRARREALEGLFIALLFACAAVGIYGGTWLIGWIIRGFMGDV
jgi:hypothetical protein